MAEVVTRGSGETERTADRAELWVTFAARGSDRAEAVTALNTRIADVEPLLAMPGVDVRSRQLAVMENWERDRVSGARAEQRYVLRVSDSGRLEELVGRLVAAEPASLSGPNWELADDHEAVWEAQHRAVADARRRAEGYAAALGARLGPLLRLTDGADGAGTFAGAARAYEMAAVDVGELNLEPQPVTITAQCTATWALLD
ncbi:hypothetical protein LX15_005526 [Streptoalloteichus tenebrarius]|uniref:SIMPL domain-containing protein n=1 Tax=Streptoalloteichus tenebrarius (strain ATCC 17920 / DSM 40477 / JCM 4838 / CBS 697.72 / NBRC 16177 / NCIMB 11028 / NRRL B-12390 / A12253. 1 / ISP 5477) TaxID=1933 RepID=A0ABT1I203_STRSD|nr:SIMPL domain-containing protein [Streptoalloteichus tenebrarius]MCP2261799.1 hypothetical protein [Streptoalloteichus tenebrarius]BFF02175.1 hypothetical protein GCM10020241_38500 [Streptoalloteichus tenebrarius]